MNLIKKNLATAVASSVVLVACGGNVNTSDEASATPTVGGNIAEYVVLDGENAVLWPQAVEETNEDADSTQDTEESMAKEEEATSEAEDDSSSVAEEAVVVVEPVEAVEEVVAEPFNELLDLTFVYFDTDESAILPQYVDMLEAHAEFLAANPGQMVVLEGHTDETGTNEYNLGLGEQRAKQVSTFLQIKGVSAGQIDAVSYGETKPLALGSTEEQYSQNRRVEIVYK